MKICEFCGEEFEPKSNAQRYCKRPHYRNCPICNKLYLEDNVENLKRPPVACSYECRAKKTQVTSLKKYGIKAPGNNKQAREKAKQTCLKNNGVEFAFQSQIIREKSKTTLLEKYGVDNISKNSKIKEKRKQTNRKKYGDTLPFNRPESYEKQHKTMLERYGVKYATLIPGNITFRRNSKTNKLFGEKLDSLNIPYEFEYNIQNKLFDIRILNTDIVIEINPSYTHSRIKTHWGRNVQPSYHQNKCQLAESNGYRCIHIFDWDDKDKICKKLKSPEIIEGKDLKIYRINTDMARSFLEENYIGKFHLGRVNIGLVRGFELLQIISIGVPQHNKDFDIEIYCACTKLGYYIKDGYDILSTQICMEFEPKSVITYIDRGKYFEKFPEEMGMTFSHHTQPKCIWSKDNKYILDSNVKQHKRDESLMIKEGWLPVYDCGKMVFQWKE